MLPLSKVKLHRFFQRFQLTQQKLWDSASAKTTFILPSRLNQLYGDPIRGQVCVHYRCSSINAQDSQSDHSLFMYIVLHFKYTLEISLKGRGATTGIWLLIPCLLWFDVDGCRMILNIVLVGFTVKLQTGKTGLRKILNLI